MATAYANVNPEIIIWARQRANLSMDALSTRSGLPNVDRLSKWEQGELLPTFKQAQTFARATHIPFGYLFLPEPPPNEDKLPIPDLRTVGSEPLRKPSPELIETVRHVLVRQAWYKEYLSSSGFEQNEFVARVDFNSSVESIVGDIREQLGVPEIPEKGTWDAYNRELIAKIESKNILVMRSGIVGNNTHRPLSVKEFRGFALSDNFAPVIFINAADAPEARLFTLIHELAHIWLGITGVTDAKPNTHREEEKKCNAVAAEFLVPNKKFVELWDSTLDSWFENLARIASIFHVSHWVIARKALDNKFISAAEYYSYTQKVLEKFRKADSSGGNFYRTLKGKFSQRLSKAVVAETLSGRTLYRDAANLLGIKPVKIKKFAKELGF